MCVRPRGKENALDTGTENYLRFLCGDESGLVQIVTQYKDGLIFYLNSIVGDLHLAEDLAEDTFVRLFTKKPRDKGKGSFKTWLYASGHNVAVSYLRRASAKNEIPMELCEPMLDSGEDPAGLYLQEESKVALHRAMGKLKPEYRQVLWLIYFENFSCKEAAAVMRKSVHNTEVLASRARQALKAQLNKEGFVYEIQ